MQKARCSWLSNRSLPHTLQCRVHARECAPSSIPSPSFRFCRQKRNEGILQWPQAENQEFKIISFVLPTFHIRLSHQVPHQLLLIHLFSGIFCISCSSSEIFGILSTCNLRVYFAVDGRAIMAALNPRCPFPSCLHKS